MKVTVNVFLKEGVLDPAGKAVEHALISLGFKGVNEVKIGKQIILNVDDDTDDESIHKMCHDLLANLVIENYKIIKG